MTEFPLLPVRHGSAQLYLMGIDISSLQFVGVLFLGYDLKCVSFAIFCHILPTITMPTTLEQDTEEGTQCFHTNLNSVVRILVRQIPNPQGKF